MCNGERESWETKIGLLNFSHVLLYLCRPTCTCYNVKTSVTHAGVSTSILGLQLWGPIFWNVDLFDNWWPQMRLLLHFARIDLSTSEWVCLHALSIWTRKAFPQGSLVRSIDPATGRCIVSRSIIETVIEVYCLQPCARSASASRESSVDWRNKCPPPLQSTRLDLAIKSPPPHILQTQLKHHGTGYSKKLETKGETGILLGACPFRVEWTSVDAAISHRFHSDTFYSIASKLFSLAGMQGSGALLSSNLEEAIYTIHNTYTFHIHIGYIKNLKNLNS